jgi:hypothetical protein
LSGRRLVLAVLVLAVFSLAGTAKANESSLATVSISPQHVTVEAGKTFQVSVVINNVSKLQGFEITLFYENLRINCLAVEEGDFLSRVGHTYIVKSEINNTYNSIFGRVWFAVVIYGEGFADGDGILASLTFDATSAGESRLDLCSENPYDPDRVRLATCVGVPIPHVAVDGRVTITPSDLGDPDPPLSADVNGDGVVNIVDVSTVARAFGRVKGDEHYGSRLDLNQDGVINIVDVTIVVSAFGKQG